MGRGSEAHTAGSLSRKHSSDLCRAGRGEAGLLGTWLTEHGVSRSPGSSECDLRLQLPELNEPPLGMVLLGELWLVSPSFVALHLIRLPGSFLS